MPITWIIPYHNCDYYQGIDGDIWVKLDIPPEHVSDYTKQWSSVLVKPYQVRRTSQKGLNGIINVNDKTNIKCAIRTPGWTMKITEILKPDQIIGRYLKWYAISYCVRNKLAYQEHPSMDYYNIWKKTEISLLNYVKKWYGEN